MIGIPTSHIKFIALLQSLFFFNKFTNSFNKDFLKFENS